MKKLTILLICITIAVPVWAALPLIDLYGLRDTKKLEQLIEAEQVVADSPKAQKRLGIAWHNLAVLEKSGAAREAYEILKPLSEALPGDYVVLAYLGSAQTMKARDSWNVFTKISEANKGIALLDKAVAKERENIVIRIVRVNNSLALPEFMGRQERAEKDLFHLAMLFDSDKNAGNAAARGEVYLKLGEMLKRQDKLEQAEIYLNKAIDAAPGLQWAQQAQDALHD